MDSPQRILHSLRCSQYTEEEKTGRSTFLFLLPRSKRSPRP
jgi:hypothetical protein